MKKGTLSKIISAVVAVVLVAAVAIGLYFYFSKKEPVEPGAQATALSAPQNVAFDKDTYTLSWSSVENASGYQISYNDSLINVDINSTSKQIFLTSEENTFKVKAVGSNIIYEGQTNYSDSAWSNEVTCNIVKNAAEQTTFEKVNLSLAKIAKENNLELQRVIGISYLDNANFDGTVNIEFQTICKDNGVEKNYRFCFGYKEAINDIEMFDNLSTADNIGVHENNKIVNYDSAKCLINSGDYDGKMKELKEQGYKISVVDSCIREGEVLESSFYFDIVGTYKAQLGDDIKYFTSTTQITVKQNSSNEKENYTQSVSLAHRRSVKETRFVLHEGTMAYMGELIKRAPAV